MTRWKKAITTLAVLAVVTALAAPALALENIDLTAKGSVTVDVQEPAYKDDLAAAGSALHVKAYKVASVNEYGAFTLTEAFGALAESGQWNGGIVNDAEQLKALQDAAVAVLTPAEPAEGEEAGSPAEVPAAAEADITIGEAAEGEEAVRAVAVSEPGLYLIVTDTAQTTRYEYTFTPVLLAIPSLVPADPEAEGGEDAWDYDVEMYLKAEQVSRLTDLVIDKTVLQYNATLGPTTFVFEVTASDYVGGTLTVLYNNVVSLTVDGPGTHSVTVKDLPVGAQVVVQEIYTGASYEPVGGAVSVSIEELPLPEGDNVARVAFTNDYDDSRIPDDSVVNRFVYNGTGWHWENSGEAQG